MIQYMDYYRILGAEDGELPSLCRCRVVSDHLQGTTLVSLMALESSETLTNAPVFVNALEALKRQEFRKVFAMLYLRLSPVGTASAQTLCTNLRSLDDRKASIRLPIYTGNHESWLIWLVPVKIACEVTAVFYHCTADQLGILRSAR